MLPEGGSSLNHWSDSIRFWEDMGLNPGQVMDFLVTKSAMGGYPGHLTTKPVA